VSDFLLELFSEEIPARMQARAEADLERLFTAKLKEAGLEWSALETVSGPRRIGLHMTGLPARTADVREERKGPRTDAPEKALEGFLRGAGLTSLDQCRIEENKKGAFYIAVIEKPGRETAEVIAEALPEMVKAFPWPKSMKFGEGDKTQRWVRPLQRIIALLDGEIVQTEVFGIKAANITEGHRIHGSGPFEVSGWDDYCAKLKANGVLLSRTERRAKILKDARKVCADAGLTLVDDEGLLDEVTGLVEHPNAILGDMDPGFLDLPPEVIQLTMKTHQKYFAVEDKSGKITAKFVVIANQDAPDGGTAIAAGNARVLSARLSDARHFWDLDRAKGLEAMADELSKVTFHEKLGTVADKTERVAALARELAEFVGADPELAFIAATLAKADLVSQMVYEFPELQGVMGRYYALASPPSVRSADTSPVNRGGQRAEDDAAMSPPAGGGSGPKGRGGLLAGLSDDQRQAVADAIRDHYKPQGPSDAVPTAPVSAAVALADKLDTLVGFWAIDEKPTGSKDPFALRRAALGVIRVLLEGGETFSQLIGIENAYWRFVEPDFSGKRAWWSCISSEIHAGGIKNISPIHERSQVLDSSSEVRHRRAAFFEKSSAFAQPVHLTQADVLSDVIVSIASLEEIIKSLLAFFAERLKVHLKGEGVRHDVIDAVFAPRSDGTVDDDLVRVAQKSRALQAFLETSDGAALLAGYRRAANILSAEEKKGFDLSAALSEALPDIAHIEFPAKSRTGSGAQSRDLSEGEAPETGQGPGSASPSGTSESRQLSDEQIAALFIAIAKTADTDEERALIAELQAAEAVATKALGEEDFESAMAALSKLRSSVDAFFEAVVVNAEDPIVRRNRLLLLSRIRAGVDAVADFSRLEG
jgi:glycyl-tRNA synthetase beta chain